MPGGVLVGAVEACWAHNLLRDVVFEVFGRLVLFSLLLFMGSFAPLYILFMARTLLE